MWESPIYKFRAPGVTVEGKKVVKEVVIDVTLSAPTFASPGKLLEGVFEEVLKLSAEEENISILDFGAGKLRNTIYLLDKGYSVCAVEYEKLWKESKQMQKNIELARKHGDRFSKLIYPHEFVDTDNNTYDLVILINVTNVMPVPYERLLVLHHCYRKLKPGGLLLWYTSYGQSSYKHRFTPETQIGDGYYTGEGHRRYKAFYREFKDNKEIDEMLFCNGFEFVQSISVNNSKARVYRKLKGRKHNIFKPVLSESKLKKELNFKPRDIKDPKDKKVKVFEKPGEVKLHPTTTETLAMEAQYVEALSKMPRGDKDAHNYHNLALLILQRLFTPNLNGFEKEAEINEGRKRIDIVANNVGEQGFWRRLNDFYKIRCPFIFFECKNYSNDLGNPEVDQLSGRFDMTPRTTSRGEFGILVFREVEEENLLEQRCRDVFDNGHGYIIFLDDNDLTELLKMKFEDKHNEIDNYLDQKMKRLLFNRR